MEHRNILHLLNEANDSKFVTRKWNIANDQTNVNYDVGNVKSNLCDFNDTYILVRGDNTNTATPVAQVLFKNCAPFTKCITKIDRTTIDNAEDSDLVMPM